MDAAEGLHLSGGQHHSDQLEHRGQQVLISSSPSPLASLATAHKNKQRTHRATCFFNICVFSGFIALFSFSIGSYANNNATYTDFFIGSSFIKAPFLDFKAIIEEMDATQDNKGRYVVDCVKVPSLPPLKLLLTAENGAYELFVQAKDYVRNVNFCCVPE